MKGKLSQKNALEFILAGNATITFLNSSTLNRFTFKVKKAKDNDIYFVKVLTSPEIYTFIGTIFNKKFKFSNKSKISADSKSVEVFTYVFGKLITETLPGIIELWHEGKCGKCGKQLTVPTSIEIGIGPNCQKMMDKSFIRNIKIKSILDN